MNSSVKVISVAARGSLLSRAQVQEVLELLQRFYKGVTFIPEWIETRGDKDQATSLLGLEKTDFFTKEVDEAVLDGRCQIAVHSAKDLPEEIAQELSVVAYTKGVDPSDVLVFRPGENLHTLSKTPRVGSSSLRRKENVLAFLPNCTFVDVRGPIEKRLELVDGGELDALILAKAALIRLRIQRESLVLPGEIAPMQGRLAVLAKKEDKEMRALFSLCHEPSS